MTYNTTSADMSEALSISSKRKNRNDLLISSKEMLLREAQNRAEFAFMEEFHCDFLVDPIYKFDLEEISSILNISNENCRATMSRAKESLRKKLNENGK
jgi:hypothetical protein